MDTLHRLSRLLAEPDPPELVGRGHILTCPGRPNRRVTVLLPLLTRWSVRRHLDVDPQIAECQPARMARPLRLWRRA